MVIWEERYLLCYPSTVRESKRQLLLLQTTEHLSNSRKVFLNWCRIRMYSQINKNGQQKKKNICNVKEINNNTEPISTSAEAEPFDFFQNAEKNVSVQKQLKPLFFLQWDQINFPQLQFLITELITIRKYKFQKKYK